jgi:hypothetical protein
MTETTNLKSITVTVATALVVTGLCQTKFCEPVGKDRARTIGIRPSTLVVSADLENWPAPGRAVHRGRVLVRRSPKEGDMNSLPSSGSITNKSTTRSSAARSAAAVSAARSSFRPMSLNELSVHSKKTMLNQCDGMIPRTRPWSRSSRDRRGRAAGTRKGHLTMGLMH